MRARGVAPVARIRPRSEQRDGQMDDQRVAAFLAQVVATGDSGGYDELMRHGAAFAETLLRLACDPACAHRLLAATLLKHAVDGARGAVSVESRTRLATCPEAQADGPLGEQLREAAARLAWHQWPHQWPLCMRECPVRVRAAVLRTLRRKVSQQAALQSEAQWAADVGGPLALLRQAAKCGARLPFERLLAAQLPAVELLRLFGCSRDECWSGLRDRVAVAAAAEALARPKLCCRLLERCGNVALAAQTALRLLAVGKEGLPAAGDLWEYAFGKAPRECIALLQQRGVGPAVVARALLRSDTETLHELRLVSPWAALQTLLAPSAACDDAFRLLTRWAAELPGQRERSQCVAVCLRTGSVAALEALAAVACDARYEGPRDNARHVVAALERGCAEEDDALALLRALWLLVDVRGERGVDTVPLLWPRCRGHPLMQALLLRIVAAACPAARAVPVLLREAISTAADYLLDDIFNLWLEFVRHCAGERELLPLLLPLLGEPASWDVLAQYAANGAPMSPFVLPPVCGSGAGEVAVVLRRLGLLDKLFAASGGRLFVPQQELLRLASAPHHAAIRCRALSLACQAGIAGVLPLLVDMLPHLEEWLPGEALRPCLQLLAAHSPPPLERLAVVASLCVLADCPLLGRDMLRRCAALHGPQAVAAAVADPTVFNLLWNA